MKKIITLVSACLMGFSSLQAQVPVKEQPVDFTNDQKVKIEILAKEYEKQGFDEKQARMKAETEIAPEVASRIAQSPWLYANHTAWLASTPTPGSIHVDRDATIHGYTPEELVKKILLKSYTAADEARIKNVRFLGWQGVAGGGNAWNESNPNTSGYGTGNRGLAYFTKGTSDFDIEKGLLLSTSHTWGHEGPNKETAAFGLGVNYGGVVVNAGYGSSDATTFDCDMRDFVIKATASVGGVLEFDFCPAIGESSFDYIFGSEEYPEYVHSSFNDGFGFFISGPYLDAATSMSEGQNRISTHNSTTNVPGISLPSGRNARGTATYNGENYATYYQYNIAQLPNGDPVGVDWTNWGYRGSNTSVSWNTLVGANISTPWDSTGVGAWLVANSKENLHNTSGSNIRYKAFNPQYHTPIVQDSVLMELDGITVQLTAKMDGLIPGMWYHLKIIVSQTDVAHGDGVFIGNLDLGYAGGNIAGPNSDIGVADIDAMGLDADGEVMYLYGSRSCCNYPMKLTFDATAASNKQIVDIEYITEPGYVFPKSALQNMDGGRLFPVDTIQLNGLQDTVMNFNFKVSADFDGFVNGQYIGLYVSVRGGGGDTVFFQQLYDTLAWNPVYRMVTDVDKGYLNLNVSNANSTVHRSIDGGSTWRPVSEGFSQWDLLYIGEECDILLYQAYYCDFDTIKIRKPSETVIVQRYINIPEVAGVMTVPGVGKHYIDSRKDFSFSAYYGGDPMSVKATGYYSRTTLNLDASAEVQADGSYKYTIRQVVEPWTISFEPKTNSGDVSNEAFDVQPVWSSGNTLYINAQDKSVANIYTLTGVLYKQVEVGGNSAIRLPRGFYIVSLDGTQYKIMIK